MVLHTTSVETPCVLVLMTCAYTLSGVVFLVHTRWYKNNVMYITLYPYYVGARLLCILTPTMWEKTYYVSTDLLCAGAPTMLTSTYYVREHLLCGGTPIM